MLCQGSQGRGALLPAAAAISIAGNGVQQQAGIETALLLSSDLLKSPEIGKIC